MTATSEPRGGDRHYGKLLNPAPQPGQYGLLDPESFRPSMLDEAPVNRLREPHCQKGS
ncbi:hypothetical protein [Micromonospora zamorensis]|uniref:hypothetical protein n=1 Tax=Micromonospora zamorensis TaxID=709883 RepID=UPI003CE73949